MWRRAPRQRDAGGLERHAARRSPRPLRRRRARTTSCSASSRSTPTSSRDARAGAAAARRDRLRRSCRSCSTPPTSSRRRARAASAGRSTRRSSCSAARSSLAHAKDVRHDGERRRRRQGGLDYGHYVVAAAPGRLRRAARRSTAWPRPRSPRAWRFLGRPCAARRARVMPRFAATAWRSPTTTPARARRSLPARPRRRRRAARPRRRRPAGGCSRSSAAGTGASRARARSDARLRDVRARRGGAARRARPRRTSCSAASRWAPASRCGSRCCAPERVRALVLVRPAWFTTPSPANRCLPARRRAAEDRRPAARTSRTQGEPDLSGRGPSRGSLPIRCSPNSTVRPPSSGQRCSSGCPRIGHSRPQRRGRSSACPHSSSQPIATPSIR